MCQGKLKKLKVAAALVALLGSPSLTIAATGGKAKLDAVKEVPVCSSQGSGTFDISISDDGLSAEYTLTYEALEGTVTVAHIHLGKQTEAGGIIAFLCGGGGKPDCPPSPATVTGTLVAGDIIGPANQGIAEGEFDEFVLALQKRLTYANVHSDICPGGEIRGQIKR